MLVNISESEKDVSIMVGHFSIYVFESVLFVCGKRQNYEWIDTKRSGITKNGLESVLQGLQ